MLGNCGRCCKTACGFSCFQSFLIPGCCAPFMLHKRVLLAGFPLEPFSYMLLQASSRCCSSMLACVFSICWKRNWWPVDRNWVRRGSVWTSFCWVAVRCSLVKRCWSRVVRLSQLHGVIVVPGSDWDPQVLRYLFGLSYLRFLFSKGKLLVTGVIILRVFLYTHCCNLKALEHGLVVEPPNLINRVVRVTISMRMQ